jgi:hypothetical protein
MARAAQVMVALALGALMGFVFRGLLETRSDVEPQAAPAARGAASSVSPAAESDPASEREFVGRLRRANERLRAELVSESALREALQGELEELRQKLADAVEATPQVAVDPSRSQSKDRDETARLQWFDEALLLEAGLTPAEIEALRERFEGIEMERLYLRDEATRDGWLNTHRYRKSAGELEVAFHALRNDFGDEVYDWLLFASGRNNRVAVGGVLEDSPAAEAGLESGDLIISYDGARIFGARELQMATTGGEAGRLVVLEFYRGGERVRVYVPRGPLGIRLGEQTRRPGGWR